MIVFPQQNKVLITPPKTGSTTAHKFYCEELKLGVIVEASQGDVDGDVGRHTTHVPHQYQHFDVLVLSRSADERFISLYKHYNRSHGPVLFEDYLKFWKKLSWFYTWHLIKYLPIEGDFKLVSIKDDFLNMGVKNIPIYNSIPLVGAITHKTPWSEYAVG